MQFLHEYQGFPLNLRDTARILTLLGNGENKNKLLQEQSGFGDNKVRGIKEYLKDFDLLTSDKGLSDLGKTILKHDPRFIEDFTKWVILYHWSSSRNNPILHFIIHAIIDQSNVEKIQKEFKVWALKNQIKTDYQKNFVAGLLRKVLNSLTNPESFQNLSLMMIAGDIVKRTEPYNVHPLLVGYILYDNRRGRTSMRFDELLQEDQNVGKFFGFNSKMLEKQIYSLRDAGLVKYVTHADLHLIEFTFEGQALDLLERFYEQN